jgi:hypothetical protein
MAAEWNAKITEQCKRVHELCTIKSMLLMSRFKLVVAELMAVHLMFAVMMGGVLRLCLTPLWCIALVCVFIATAFQKVPFIANRRARAIRYFDCHRDVISLRDRAQAFPTKELPNITTMDECVLRLRSMTDECMDLSSKAANA